MELKMDITSFKKSDRDKVKDVAFGCLWLVYASKAQSGQHTMQLRIHNNNSAKKKKDTQ